MGQLLDALNELDRQAEAIQHSTVVSQEEAVALVLTDLGIKGERWSAGDMCPIRRYLWAKGAYLPEVDVGVSYDFATGEQVDNPLRIQRFINAFDDGRFPRLEG